MIATVDSCLPILVNFELNKHLSRKFNVCSHWIRKHLYRSNTWRSDLKDAIILKQIYLRQVIEDVNNGCQSKYSHIKAFVQLTFPEVGSSSN